jgi:L,D-transpeptidase ErfK/SrfK
MERMNATRGSQRGRSLAALIVTVLLASGTVGCALFEKPAPKAEVADQVPAFPYLRLKLGERRLYLIEQEGKPGDSFLVAIGRKPWETPTGTFKINQKVENPDWLVVDFKNPDKPSKVRVPPGPNNPMGLRWMSFASAHGWEVGFHGTSKEQFLGQAVSHGCVRMKNSDIVKLFPLVQIGTTVIVEE